MFYLSTQYRSSEPSFLCDSSPVFAIACTSSYHLLDTLCPATATPVSTRMPPSTIALLQASYVSLHHSMNNTS